MAESGGKDPPDPGVNNMEKRTGKQDGGKQMMENKQERESCLYTVRDEGPYRVYIENINQENKENKINKFAVGSMIKKLNDYRNFVMELRYLGRNKIIAFFTSYTKANLFVGDQQVKEKGYKTYVPRHLVSIRGVLAGIPVDISEEEIKMEIECEYQILNVYRLNRYVNGESKPTNRVSITFRANQLPEKVKLFCCTNRVQPFVQKLLFCDKCHRFNHKTDNCNGRQRCSRCAGIHEESDVNYKNCTNQVKCFYCKSAHSTTDPNCPEREKQQRIKTMMAKRNLTYIEAREMIVPQLSSNIYEPLADGKEYPTPAESFAKMTAGKFARKSTTETGVMPKRRVEGNQHNRMQTATQRSNDGQEKRRKMEIERNQILNEFRMDVTPTFGTGLKNKHATTDKERWDSIIEEANKNANENAERNLRGTLMNFYSALVQKSNLPKHVREDIRELSKEHFKLSNTIF